MRSTRSRGFQPNRYTRISDFQPILHTAFWGLGGRRSSGIFPGGICIWIFPEGINDVQTVAGKYLSIINVIVMIVVSIIISIVIIVTHRLPATLPTGFQPSGQVTRPGQTDQAKPEHAKAHRTIPGPAIRTYPTGNDLAEPGQTRPCQARAGHARPATPYQRNPEQAREYVT